jgi:hypothetical protein
MSDTPVTPSRQTIYEKDVKYKRSWSEALGFKIGSAINFINSRVVYTERVDFGGYFRPTSIDQLEHEIYIWKPTKISAYAMSVASTANGDHGINYTIIDNNGVGVGSLFSTFPNINGSGSSNVAVGRDLKANTTLERNTSGLTIDNGVLDLTFLDTDGLPLIPAGYSLRPIIAGSGNAILLSCTLFMEVQE